MRNNHDNAICVMNAVLCIIVVLFGFLYFYIFGCPPTYEGRNRKKTVVEKHHRLILTHK